MKKITWSIVVSLHFLISSRLCAQGIEIQSGAVIEATGNPTVEITDGNFVNNGTYIRSAETILLSGTTADTISGSSNSDLYILTINNSNGVTLAGSGNLTVNKTLIFTNGLVTTGSNVLIIADSATISGAGTTTYINGSCRKTGNQAFIFPVGKNGKYAPVGISAPGNATDQFEASFTMGNPNSSYSTTSLGPGIDHVSTCEYWTVCRMIGSSNSAVVLTWDTGSCGVTNLNELSVARWDSTNWVNAGNAGTTGTTQAGTITSNTQNSLGHFIIASTTINNPLPIGLFFFIAHKKGDQQVELQWSTTSEVNNDYFTIEKSTDFLSWEIIGNVKGAGNSTHQNNYVHTDLNPYPGVQYYRLKQTDYDGNYTYSEIRTVNFNSVDDQAISLYPSPANATVSVSLKGRETENTTIRILSFDGRAITEHTTLNGNICVLDVSTFANGIYFIEVNRQGKISRLKLVKN